MRLPVIMLVGQAGSGKDTVAGFLAKNHGAVVIAQADPMKRLASKLFGFTEDELWGPSENRNALAHRVALDQSWNDVAWPWLAEVLPGAGSAAAVKLGAWITSLPAQPSARKVLQTLGTEWGRAFSRNMWVDLALRNARAILAGDSYARTAGILPDVPSNASWVVITDGRFRNEVLAVREAGGLVVRIDSPGSGLAGVAAQHASEQEQKNIPDAWFDAVLTNDKSHGLAELEFTVGTLVKRLVDPPHKVSTWVPAPLEASP